MNARVQWVDGVTFVGRSASGHSIVLGGKAGPDNPGAGAPSPMELVLLALGGCTGLDVVSILAKKRQNVEGFYVNIDADRAEEHPRVFSHVEVEYVFRGNLDPKAVEDAVRLSQEKYCSVSAMVGARATVSYRIRIENGE